MIFPGIITAIVSISVIAGLMTAGSPNEERLRRFDDQRISNLEQIRFGAIDSFYTDRGELPQTLEEAQKHWSGDGSIFMDPKTQELFEYRPTGPRTYELCAIFDLPMDEDQAKRQSVWIHDVGRTCFTFTARSNVIESGKPLPIETYAP